MGEVFAGRYELADPIGRGGVGAVWRAWDHRRRRYVAAKVLQQRDAHSLLRFVREQGLRIDHPHVLAPASWAADDDKVLFTMDLVAGGSLVHLVNDYGPLPPAFVCGLLDQLLSGLAAVHAEGVVHRDIKPANVLLEATGTARPRLRLSDFGIAMRLGEPRLTETNLVVGTPGYLAPEQMMGAEPDFPADLFAVGLVALYLLEGAKPDAKALVKYFAEHGTPGAPKGIPDPLWQVVAMLLQPDPQARFRTATGARKALAATAELLPEPGPDDELIEIFDQLGPLPQGFGPEGPLTDRLGHPGPRNHTGRTSPIGLTGPTGPRSRTGHTGPTGPTGSTGERILPARPTTPPDGSFPVRPDALPGHARPGTDSLPARPLTPPGPSAPAGPGETSPHTASTPTPSLSGPVGPVPPRPPAHPPTVTPTPTPTPTPSMSDTGSFHLPPPLPTVTATPTPTPSATPTPTPPPAPYDPTLPLLPSPGPRAATATATASYTAQDPVAEASRPRGHRAVRQRRPGPPVRVTVPVLLLALACYAVGFWALTRI
ncbi:serine/threonine-protein kinase [Streptomyces sp. DSM 15324]|uniref:serine/threonine-protein kinase n=1 Tax=Streptomyces sp. DSM 15324 TaxID=1739111 RepID=UPI00074A5888|nr:serine/threonine-protein kinase [Streptomyces sp. DSM 15324]KUO08629.1 serine/threonine protein kinase [Streptomyces sp. DSM 15324]